MNGKYLMIEKQGTLWNKAAVGYFEFPHYLQSAHPIYLPRFEPRISQTKNKQASPSHHRTVLQRQHITQSETPPHRQSIIQSTTYSTIDHTLHRLSVWITYAACCLERQSTLHWNRTSGLDTSIRTGIYIIALKVTDHTYKKNLIFVQRTQMTSALNIRMAFISKEPACN
jgi:hypothetical protein